MAARERKAVVSSGCNPHPVLPDVAQAGVAKCSGDIAGPIGRAIIDYNDFKFYFLG